MIQTCNWCKSDFDHIMSPRGGRNCLYCSEECRKLAKAETLRVYNREHRTVIAKHSHRPILVTYPGVAYVDRWTLHDYRAYKHELPPGTTVEFAT